MRKLIRTFFSLFGIVAIAVGLAAFQWLSVVGSKQKAASAIVLDGSGCSHDNGGSSSNTVVCPSFTPLAGSLIVCSGLMSNSASFIDSIADAVNGSYSLTHEVTSSSKVQWYAYMQNAANSAITPTMTADDSLAGHRISCRAYKNVRTTLVLDNGAIAQEHTVTDQNPTSGSAQTPTNDNEVIDCGLWTTGSPTQGSGFTIIDNTTSLFPEYQVQTTKTAVNCPYTMTSAAYSDQQNAFLPSSASAISNTPPTGTKFYERWTLGGTSCGAFTGAACDNAWTNGSGTAGSLVDITWTPPANVSTTKALQMSGTTSDYIRTAVTQIPAGTAFDTTFAWQPISTNLSGSGTGTDIVTAAVLNNSTTGGPWYMEWNHQGNGLKMRVVGDTASANIPVTNNTWVKVTVHVDSTLANSTATFCFIGGCQTSTFTAHSGNTNFIIIGDPANTNAKTFLVSGFAGN